MVRPKGSELARGLEGSLTATMPLARRTGGAPSIRLWFAWVAAFYLVWGCYVLHGGHLTTVLANWPIALSMSLGSYAAGATPMGGGTVGFPILVLAFGRTPEVGRDFSFAIQSVGMTSASLLILCRRQPLHWSVLRPALWATLFGTPIGLLVLAPRMPALATKITFAVITAAFGVLHLFRYRRFIRHQGPIPVRTELDRWIGLTVGFGASLFVSSVTGVGIDMLLYVVLVLLCQADLRIAIPSSVLLMAATSLVGIATGVLSRTVAPKVGPLWLAAAPVVILGAPLGAWAVDRVGRTVTLFSVSCLCLVQFAWTLYHERGALGTSGTVIAFLALAVVNFCFDSLGRLGTSLNCRSGSRGSAMVD